MNITQVTRILVLLQLITIKMNAYSLPLQRALLALCIFLLNSCTPPICRQWNLQVVQSRYLCYNTGRMVLAPQASNCYLELELVRYTSGLRLYLNILYLQALPDPNYPEFTEVTLLFDDQEPIKDYLYLFEGNQRLLFSNELMLKVLDALQEGISFKIQLGKASLEVVPDQFLELYDKLLGIPIVQPCEPEFVCE